VPFQNAIQGLWRGESEKQKQVHSTPLKYASLRMTGFVVGRERKEDAGPFDSLKCASLGMTGLGAFAGGCCFGFCFVDAEEAEDSAHLEGLGNEVGRLDQLGGAAEF